MEAASSSSSSSSFSPTNQQHPSVHWHYGDVDDSNFQAHGRSLVLVIVVFSVLLFLTLLCLYARWACRYRRMVISVSSSSSSSADYGGGGVYAVSAGLDRDVINGIPVILFQATEKKMVVTAGGHEEEKGLRCSICLSTFREGDKVKLLPGCGHMFHPDCVDEWLRSQPTCPLCRSTLAGRVGDVGREQQLGEADAAAAV